MGALDTTTGPDVHVWLSQAEVVEGLSGWRTAAGPPHVDLGMIKGNKGDQGTGDSRLGRPRRLPVGVPVVRAVQRVLRRGRADPDLRGLLMRRRGIPLTT